MSVLYKSINSPRIGVVVFHCNPKTADIQTPLILRILTLIL